MGIQGSSRNQVPTRSPFFKAAELEGLLAIYEAVLFNWIDYSGNNHYRDDRLPIKIKIDIQLKIALGSDRLPNLPRSVN